MQFFLLTFKRYLIVWIGLFWAISSSLLADIVTDGSVGPAQSLSGPNFSIPETLGSRAGNNLFHSFLRFNINNGEQANYTGAANIANVISRVTGGQISNIDGLLQSTIGQADFYFLNPAGVVFGANAQIDVPASFYLSTADKLRFSDGSTYSATNPKASSLTIAQPEAFGFLGNQTSNITIQQSNLNLSSGSTLSLISSDLSISNAQLLIDAGEIMFAAIGNNATEVIVSGEPSIPAQGDLKINNSVVNVSGAGAGHIVTRSGAIQINGSSVEADNLGSIHADSSKGIDIDASSLQIDGSQISTNTLGLGLNAADITLNISGKLSIKNAGTLRSLVASAGNAGNISIAAGNITIDNGASIINAVLAGPAATGTINITAKESFSMLNSSQILSSSLDANTAGKLTLKAKNITLDKNANIFSLTSGTANAGAIEVSAIESLDVFNGSKINSTAQLSSNGNAGNVTLQAKNITLDGQVQLGGLSVVIGSRSLGNGNAGNTQIVAEQSINLFNSAVISNDTFFNGQGGDINITANTLTLNGNGFTTGISSTTAGSNDAGKVVINVSNLNILNAAGIASGAQDISHLTPLINHPATGNAGQIILHADNIILNDGTITIDTDVILPSSLVPSNSAASIQIDAQNFSIINSSVTTESTGNVPAGAITITVAGVLSIDPSIISTAANNANGGAISIQANVINLQDSQITTSVTGQGNGGNISLNSNVLVLDSGFIQANTAGSNVAGGNIQINTQSLISSQGGIQTGGNIPLSFQSGLNVIQAAAPDGVSGNVTIISPQLNISGDLTDLESELLNVDQLVKNPCETTGGRQSRLASLGQGGLPETPDQAGSVLVDSKRVEQLLASKKYGSGYSSVSIDSLNLPTAVEKECG